MVRMAHLSVVGSHSVNGVAALHTELIKKDLFPDFDTLSPGKINNKTNGITPRRWLLACNPRLSELISSKIGHGWNLDELRALEQFAEDPQFQVDFMNVKQANKVDLALIIKGTAGWWSIPPRSSTCISSACTNTSASTSTCCTFWRSTGACCRTPAW